ncbi:hypothetical protein Plav_1030 [Parvibaculum lavamentivorans DS-1]|uniref:Uncharacterized protein n=1 Tax=Parvibaculum lavamentivorans (strain DS-1 / DSM 13023 / NCIMB 13966) TaxID=402881 RepID=A7HRW9_PARL1|nr:hypothetical protein Plav_1030 [Parvibaculum lavamentivorans DS-1]
MRREIIAPSIPDIHGEASPAFRAIWHWHWDGFSELGAEVEIQLRVPFMGGIQAQENAFDPPVRTGILVEDPEVLSFQWIFRPPVGPGTSA